MGALVSRSQIVADPSILPVPMYLPVGSKRANSATANSDVCTAVGWLILKGSVKRVGYGRCGRIIRLTDQRLVHRKQLK